MALALGRALITLRSLWRAPTRHRAPAEQGLVDPFALAGDGSMVGVELTVDSGDAATVADGDDGSCSGGTYIAHGGLEFHQTKRER
jgi:hypothetical protein